MRNRSVQFYAALILLPAAYAGTDRPRAATPPREVTIALLGRADNLGVEVVNIGLPLPPGFSNDAGLVRAYSEDGTELEAAVRPLEPWRLDGKDGTIRS